MNITMLGTGHALVTDCYNTCFVLSDADKFFMVDGGGGNTILRQLKRAGFDWMDMREIFVTHKHVDHLLGIVWMIRMICQSMNHGEYKGEANIYANLELISILRNVAKTLLLEKENKFIDDRLHFIVVEDEEERMINGRRVTFFDIHSSKDKQFGFTIEIDGGERLVCCGDEPCNPCCEKYALRSKWLLHEAFCLYSQADIFEPYEKHHSTVKDACELAQRLQVKNLLLYHTEDSNLLARKHLYTLEGKRYYSGNLWIPDELETVTL